MNPDLSWAAGLFEGEGSISSRTTNGITTLTLGIEMKDEDIIRRFVDVMTTSGTRAKAAIRSRWRGNENHSRTYCWAITGTAAEHAYLLLRPQLGERRRAQADSILKRRHASLALKTTTRSCLGCGSEFTTKPLAQNKQWCSNECWHRSKDRTDHSRQLANARNRRYKQRLREQKALTPSAPSGTI